MQQPTAAFKGQTHWLSLKPQLSCGWAVWRAPVEEWETSTLGQVMENKSAWGTVSSYHVRPYDSSPHILFCVPHCCSNIKAHLCVFCELPCCRCLRKKQTNQTQWCSASSADRIVSTDYELLHFLILVGKLSDVMPGLLFVSPQSCFRVKHRFLPKWRKDFKYFSDYKKNVTKIACHLFLN